MKARGRGEEGAVALLALCGGLVLLLAGALVLSAVTDVGVAAARARTAADAAALAAVAPSTVAGCDLARDLAQANGASLTTCRLPAAGAAVVEVSVLPRSPQVRRLVGELPARAAAILDPRTPAPAP